MIEPDLDNPQLFKLPCALCGKPQNVSGNFYSGWNAVDEVRWYSWAHDGCVATKTKKANPKAAARELMSNREYP